MRRFLVACALVACAFVLVVALPTVASAQQQTRWRFEFSGAHAQGGVRVPAGTRFDAASGYGFEPGASQLFSLVVPEGDYRVTVSVNDGARVYAETRRLMLEANARPRGRLAARTFVVNVRTPHLAPPPQNAPGGEAVRLGAREAGSLDWDDKLTIEVDGRMASLVVERVEVPRIFLLGDSTVADQAEAPYASWGQMLTRFFGADAAIANHAQSGESLRTFLAGLRLEKALADMRPGDWALIQFGHNDQKSQWPQSYAAPESTYRAYLRLYIEEIRRRGGHAVLVTSVQRRTFNAAGRIENSHGQYPDAVRAVAREMNVPVVDLHAMTTTFYEAIGPARSVEAFAPRDGTHHNAYGAYEIARCVVEAIRTQRLPIARYLRDDVAPFDPAHPDPMDSATFR